MALELRQQLKLTQQLVMTPQLQQAIKLLQLSRLELVGLLQRELEENPVLEEALDADDGSAANGAAEAGVGDAGPAVDAEAAAEAPRSETDDAEVAGADREPTDA